MRMGASTNAYPSFPPSTPLQGPIWPPKCNSREIDFLLLTRIPVTVTVYRGTGRVNWKAAVLLCRATPCRLARHLVSFFSNPFGPSLILLQNILHLTLVWKVLLEKNVATTRTVRITYIHLSRSIPSLAQHREP